LKTAIIMRGLPGSLKSTAAELLAKDKEARIHSTDQFFVVNGEYRFNPKLLSINHSRNLAAFRKSLADGVPLVICDNTNIRRTHFQPYVEAAQNFGYSVMVLSMPHPNPEEAAAKNIHHVPEHAIRQMLEEWED
jgi:predicted kinase